MDTIVTHLQYIRRHTVSIVIVNEVYGGEGPTLRCKKEVTVDGKGSEEMAQPSEGAGKGREATMDDVGFDTPSTTIPTSSMVSISEGNKILNISVYIFNLKHHLA